MPAHSTIGRSRIDPAVPPPTNWLPCRNDIRSRRACTQATPACNCQRGAVAMLVVPSAFRRHRHRLALRGPTG